MRPDFTTSHSITVHASAQRCYDCLRAIEMTRSPLVRALLTLRGLRRFRTLDDVMTAGFTLLADEPPQCLALGFVGQPWRPSGRLRKLDSAELKRFAEPGFVKVIWRFDIDGDHPARVVTTTEINATSARARRSFGRYWRLVAPFSGMLRRSMLASIKDCAEAPGE